MKNNVSDIHDLEFLSLRFVQIHFIRTCFYRYFWPLVISHAIRFPPLSALRLKYTFSFCYPCLYNRQVVRNLKHIILVHVMTKMMTIMDIDSRAVGCLSILYISTANILRQKKIGPDGNFSTNRHDVHGRRSMCTCTHKTCSAALSVSLRRVCRKMLIGWSLAKISYFIFYIVVHILAKQIIPAVSLLVNLAAKLTN